jgi:NAD+ diphosphatase
MTATNSPAPAGNFYSGAGLDRADHLRRDADWLSARIGMETTWFVPVWRDKVLVETGAEARALWLRGAELGALRKSLDEAVFLGRSGDAAVFAFDLSAQETPEAEPAIAGRGAFQDLRAVGPLLARQDGAILAYARGLLHWHRRHRFCGVCGGPTEGRQGGHVRACAAQACGTDHFPRTDPAVIMLIHDGERCVLGRQKVWPDGMHSTLAGFVEPGESLEEAVAREVYEEVGIEVREVTYHSSQPWPFPSSIMLGFHAQARHGPLMVNAHELSGARWFTRQELRASPEDETLRLPRRDSIARRLIEDWLAG